MVRMVLLTLALGLMLGAFAQAQEPLKHTTDKLDAIQAKVKAGQAILLDVREQKEWDAGHLKSARLVPMSKLKSDADLKALLESIPKDKPIYLHCKAGGRALTCGEILKKHGYDVRPLSVGFTGLVEAGFEKADK